MCLTFLLASVWRIVCVGGVVYDHDYMIVDTDNHRIVKCPAAQLGGTCQTVAGTGVASTTHRSLKYPQHVALNSDGDYIIADTRNHRVLKCPAANPGGKCLTVAGMAVPGSHSWELNKPTSVAIDKDGDYVIVDQWNDRVQKCPAAKPGTNCSTVAGTGRGGAAFTQLRKPAHVVVLHQHGDYLISDPRNNRILQCPAERPGSPCDVVVGYGALQLGDVRLGGGALQKPVPRGFATDRNGDIIVANWASHRLHKCPGNSSGAACPSVAGTGARGRGKYQLYQPSSVTLDPNGDYLIADTGNHRIQLCPALCPGTTCVTVAGDGNGIAGSGESLLNGPRHIILAASDRPVLAPCDAGMTRPPGGSCRPISCCDWRSGRCRPDGEACPDRSIAPACASYTMTLASTSTRSMRGTVEQKVLDGNETKGTGKLVGGTAARRFMPALWLAGVVVALHGLF